MSRLNLLNKDIVNFIENIIEEEINENNIFFDQGKNFQEHETLLDIYNRYLNSNEQKITILTKKSYEVLNVNSNFWQSINFLPHAIIDILERSNIIDNSFYFCIFFDKARQYKKIFRAEYINNENLINKIINNQKKRIVSQNDSHGIFQESKDFKILREIAKSNEISKIEEKSNWKKYFFKEIILEFSQKDITSQPTNSKSIFNSSLIAKKFFDDFDEFVKNVKTSKYIEVQFDSKVVSSEFMKLMLNNYYGRLKLNSIKKGSTIPHITKKDFFELDFMIPSYEIQNKFISNQMIIQSNIQYLQELQMKQWIDFDFNQVSQKLEPFRSINSIESWIETLPYPIASILWLYVTSSTKEKKNGYLINFFEAFSEFMCGFILSFFNRDSENLLKYKAKWINQDNSYNDWYLKPTFGGWLNLLNLLVDLNITLEVDELQKIYDVIDEDPFTSILKNKSLIKVLKKANQIRNSYIGHSGIKNENIHNETNNYLERLLIELREIIGYAFYEYEIVSLIKTEPYDEISINEMYILKGSKFPFTEKTIRTKQRLLKDHLYIMRENKDTFIKLVDLIQVDIQVGASFYYSRFENSMTSLSSYHKLDYPQKNIKKELSFFELVK